MSATNAKFHLNMLRSFGVQICPQTQMHILTLCSLCLLITWKYLIDIKYTFTFSRLTIQQTSTFINMLF
jgi:hypothetical protein